MLELQDNNSSNFILIVDFEIFDNFINDGDPIKDETLEDYMDGEQLEENDDKIVEEENRDQIYIDSNDD